MYKCPHCGEIIKDIDNPCPTCGLYINTENNNISENKDRKSTNIIFILVLGMLIGVFLFVINSHYNSKRLEYRGNGYVLNYSTKLWSKYDKVANYSFALQYKDSKAYLFFPNEIVDLNVNVDDGSVRDNLYQLYLREFRGSATYNYFNVMSEIKALDSTDYYYLTTDFMKLDQVEHRGKIYFIYTGNGKCLTLVLVADNDNLSEVEKNIFELIETIKIEN